MVQNTSVTTEQAQELIKVWSDPVYFVQNVLNEPLFRRQGEILRAIKDESFVSVVGANGTGKDWTAARAILWWISMHKESIVVVIGPTHRQVADVVWKEVRVGYQSAINNNKPLGGSMTKLPRWEITDRRFAVGFATDSEFNIQGYHSPRLLLVITEAHGVADSHIDAGMRLNPSRVLMTGNPFTTEGKFYDSHHSSRDLWHPIQISAYDTPNVKNGEISVPGLINSQQVERRKLELGEDNPMFVAGVLGEFPDALDETLISLKIARAAVTNKLAPGNSIILGVDVAREGNDRTVVVRRDGPVARILWSVQGWDTERVAGWVGRYMESHPATGEAQSYCLIDSVGIGAGVFDKLANGDYTYELQEFKGGSKAIDKERFKDRNAEAWYNIREALLAGELDLDSNCPCAGVLDTCKQNVDGEALNRMVAQLSSRQYIIEGDRRIRLESKDNLRKKGRRSPDEADALAMTFSVRERVLEVW